VSYANPKKTKDATLGSKAMTLVFAEGKQAEDAKAAGADVVGGEELIPLVSEERWREGRE
jgi:large subunit ribosomal protein L1